MANRGQGHRSGQVKIERPYMASRISLSAGAASDPVCSQAAEHSKKSANLDNDGLESAAILTKQQAASLLQCTPRFLERQIAAGRLRACKITNKFVRILRRDLEAFLAQGATMETGQ